MFTQFFPLLVAAVATRIGANHLVRRRRSEFRYLAEDGVYIFELNSCGIR